MRLSITQHAVCVEMLDADKLIQFFQHPLKQSHRSAHFYKGGKSWAHWRVSLNTFDALISKGALIEQERLDAWRTLYTLSPEAIEAVRNEV